MHLRCVGARLPHLKRMAALTMAYNTATVQGFSLWSRHSSAILAPSATASTQRLTSYHPRAAAITPAPACNKDSVSLRAASTASGLLRLCSACRRHAHGKHAHCADFSVYSLQRRCAGSSGSKSRNG